MSRFRSKKETNMKKRKMLFTSVLLAVAAFSVLFFEPEAPATKTEQKKVPFGAVASAAIVDSGKCGDGVTWALTDDGILTVEGKGMMSSSPWSGKKVVKCVIKDGVTGICTGAFNNCKELVELTIPDSVTVIETAAFMGCESLESVIIPDGVTSIGSYAFCSCDSLKRITIPEGVERVGDFAFSSCGGLSEIAILNPETSIGRSTFEYCGGLTDVTLPEGTTSIPDGMFRECKNLSSVTIPYGVTSIGARAFMNCGSLEDLAIPESVTEIGGFAFARTSVKGIMLPSGLKKLGECVFYGCSELKELTIPSGITEIGYSSFFNCTALTSITIPSGMQKFASDSFGNCTALKKVNIDSLDSWYSCEFANEQANPLTYAEELYVGGRKLDTVVIGRDESGMKPGVFGACKFIVKFDLDEGNVNYKLSADGALCSADGTELAYPYCVTSLNISDGFDFDRLNGMSLLETVTIGADVENIPEGAFKNCVSLREITVDGGNNAYCSIGGVLYSKAADRLLAYPAMKADSGFDVPDSVKRFAPYAFANNRYLELITVSDGVTVIDDHLFFNCTALEKIVLPEKACTIGDYAFANCTSLKTLYIGDAAGAIGAYAFSGCLSLNNLRIGNGTASIGDYAFYGCESLSKVIVPFGVSSVGNCVFLGCLSLKDIYILNADCLSTDSNLGGLSDGATVYSHAGYGVENYAQSRSLTFVPVHVGDYNYEKCNASVPETQKCKYCDDDAEASVFQVLRHDFTEKVVDERYFAAEPTCADGKKYYTCCKHCGLSCKGTDEESTFTHGNALGHVEEKLNSVAPSCSKPGLTEGVRCQRCGEKLVPQKKIGSLPHTWDNGTVKRPFNLGVPGIKCFTCTVCKKTKNEYFPAFTNGKKGDVDLDGVVSVADARSALRAAVGLDVLVGKSLIAADVDGNSGVSVADARLILRVAVGLEKFDN